MIMFMSVRTVIVMPARETGRVRFTSKHIFGEVVSCKYCSAWWKHTCQAVVLVSNGVLTIMPHSVEFSIVWLTEEPEKRDSCLDRFQVGSDLRISWSLVAWCVPAHLQPGQGEKIMKDLSVGPHTDEVFVPRSTMFLAYHAGLWIACIYTKYACDNLILQLLPRYW